MKKVFWTTIFWIAIVAGFAAYLRWFNQPLAQDVTSLVLKSTTTSCVQTTALEEVSSESSTGELTGDITSGAIALVATTTTTSSLDSKLDEIKAQLKDINEKLDIQNSNTPDAVSVSLKTTKKTNVWIFPLDGSVYKKYILPASDDILRDALNLLFDKSAFALEDSKLDNDGNLTLTLQKAPSTASASADQVKAAIEKTALQFPQIKKVIIMPENILQ